MPPDDETEREKVREPTITWPTKEFICSLHRKAPEKWDVARLSASFGLKVGLGGSDAFVSSTFILSVIHRLSALAIRCTKKGGGEACWQQPPRLSANWKLC